MALFKGVRLEKIMDVPQHFFANAPPPTTFLGPSRKGGLFKFCTFLLLFLSKTSKGSACDVYCKLTSKRGVHAVQGSLDAQEGPKKTFACKSQECLWQDWYILFFVSRKEWERSYGLTRERFWLFSPVWSHFPFPMLRTPVSRKHQIRENNKQLLWDVVIS